jgi:protein tyrosine/serine phosphatase
MPRPLKWLCGLLLLTVLVGGPLAFVSYQTRTFRNFHVVAPGKLYRSGQMTLGGLQQVIHDYGIKTVVSLRDAHVPGEAPPDRTEEEYCTKEGLSYYRITPRVWWSADGTVPAAANVRRFLQIMDDPSHCPVLVHCFAGQHRTGAYVAVYRMEFEGWNNLQAIDEMRLFGYDSLDDEWDILGYLESYRPRRFHAASVPESKPGEKRPPDDLELFLKKSPVYTGPF